MKKKTTYQRIMIAARKGTGVRFTADEVWSLSQDDAIETRAQLDDENEGARNGVP